jgi:hypothetical protein
VTVERSAGLLALACLPVAGCSSTSSGTAPSVDAAVDTGGGTGVADSGGSTSGGDDGSSSGATPSNDGGSSGSPGDGGVEEASVASPCSNPGTLCWGFEEGVTMPPGWKIGRQDYGAVVLPNDATAHTGPALVADQTRPHWGKWSLHARGFVGGTPTTQGGPKATIEYTLPSTFGAVLWARMFLYLTPAPPASHAGIFNARYPRPGSTATAVTALDWYEAATYTEDYMTVWHPPEPPGYPEDVQVSGMKANVNQYDCLEWLFDGSAGDAGQASPPRMWVDGVELTWPDSFTYPDGSAPSSREPVGSFLLLETGVYMYQGLTTPTDWWIDDLAVGPQRIGCSP